MCTTTAELDMHNELSLEAPCKIDALSKVSLLVTLLNVCLLDDYQIFTFYMYKNIYNLNIDLLVLLYSKHILLKIPTNRFLTIVPYLSVPEKKSESRNIFS